MSLRDYVTPQKIKAQNQNGWWTELNFNGASGQEGSQGVELGNTFYNTKHNIYNGTTEFTVETALSYEKINTFPLPVLQEFYPIIALGMDVNTGVMHYIGFNEWWGEDFSVPSGKFGNYKITMNLKNNGYFAQNEYNFEEYFDSEASLVKTGFDTVAQAGTGPAYDIYMYKEGAYANVFDASLICLPYRLEGKVGAGWYGALDTFDVYGSIYTEAQPCYNELNTNIPVIVFDKAYYSQHPVEINNAIHSYQSDGDLSRFNSYITNDIAVMSNMYKAPSVTEGTKQYNMYCDVYNGYWDVDEVTNETLREYRYIEIWVAPTTTQQTEARVSLYKNKVGSELRCNLKVYGEIKQIRYSTDGGNNWTTEENPTQLPWEYLFYKRTDELRFLTYDKNHGGNMLLFDTEALADDGSPWLASDYNEKNFYYPATNETGTPENSTLMGTTGLASVFSKKYVVNYSDLVTIANALFTSGGMVEDLKKGLEMFGNPIEAIQGLMYLPVDCADYFSLVTSSTVILGGYEIPNTNAKLLTRFNGYFDVGSMEIKESFPSGDYRNQEPYCMLNIFLPFVGLESLKLNKYVGKTLSIRYYLDATTGECMACLFADGLLADYFTGQMGVNLPISLHDYAQFAGASMQALASIAEGGANALIGTATADVGRVAQGVTGFEGSMFNLKQNSINNFVTTKGTSSSLLNHFLPNYVYVIFEIIETDETPNLLTVEGRRTNASGNIGAFSGFLQVESVKLNCSGATENEKSKIKDLLSTGIYI